MRARLAILTVALALGPLAACAPTARTGGPYRAKASKAVEAVHSSVVTDLLVVQAAGRGRTTAAYLSVATSDAEDAASTASSSFLAMQPPDRSTERLRSDLSDLFDQAISRLGDVRIAGRRGDRQALVGHVDELRAVADALDRAAEGLG